MNTFLEGKSGAMHDGRNIWVFLNGSDNSAWTLVSVCGDESSAEEGRSSTRRREPTGGGIDDASPPKDAMSRHKENQTSEEYCSLSRPQGDAEFDINGQSSTRI